MGRKFSCFGRLLKESQGVAHALWTNDSYFSGFKRPIRSGQYLKWQSRSADPTGLIWMGARYYDPVGGRSLLLEDELRRVRFDFLRPYPYQSPHMHVDEIIGKGLWKESGQIYPIDVPHY